MRKCHIFTVENQSKRNIQPDTLLTAGCDRYEIQPSPTSSTIFNLQNKPYKRWLPGGELITESEIRDMEGPDAVINNIKD